MKKKNYTILTSGKFHYFEIAKILYERKQLSKIVSGYPWVKLKNELIHKKFIDSSGYFQIMTHFLHKIPKVNLDKLIDSIHYLNSCVCMCSIIESKYIQKCFLGNLYFILDQISLKLLTC